MRLTEINIGGSDWTGNAHLFSTKITKTLNGKVGAAELAIHAETASMALVGSAIVGKTSVGRSLSPGMEVVISDSAGPVFGGFVTTYSPRRVNLETALFSLECQDYTSLLESVVVPTAIYSAISDQSLIQALFQANLPEVNTALFVESVATIPSFELLNETLRVALDKIARLTQALWHIDAQKRLHYFAEGSRRSSFNLGELLTAFDISGTAWGVEEWGGFAWGPSATIEGAKQFLLEGFEYREEFPTPANSVTVIGDRLADVTGIHSVVPATRDEDGFVIWYDASWPVPKVSYSFVYADNEPEYWGPAYRYIPSDAEGSYANLCNTYSAGTLPDFNIIGPKYEQSNVVMRFDTSAVPAGAIIESASLFVWVNVANAVASDEMKVGVEYIDPAGWPISADSWGETPSDSASAYQDIRTYEQWLWAPRSFPLTDPSTNINTSGFTAFRWHLKTNSGGAPTGFNQFLVGLSGLADGARSPQLQIAYRIPGQSVTAIAQDLASQASYGIRKRTLVDQQIKTAEEAQLRADFEITQFATPRKSGTVNVYHDGLDVGEMITILAPSAPMGGDFVLREMLMEWPSQNVTRYSIQYGDFRPDLISMLRTMAMKSEER